MKVNSYKCLVDRNIKIDDQVWFQKFNNCVGSLFNKSLVCGSCNQVMLIKCFDEYNI